jgi:hypothetical protein
LNNCYFYIDESLPIEDQVVESICVDCHKKSYKDKPCWFWHGENLGYGPWDIKCKVCNNFIHNYTGSKVDQ